MQTRKEQLIQDHKASATFAKPSKFQLEDNRPIQQKSNKTGLPNDLKSGIENLSGHSMDDVKVHYHSAKPAQLNAHAYAQGTDIHLASGQEKHLPHEAWHVVQQKQGRVKPTLQMKGKVNVNDDEGLEREADVMGAKALNSSANNRDVQLKATFDKVVQREVKSFNAGEGRTLYYSSYQRAMEPDNLSLHTQEEAQRIDVEYRARWENRMGHAAAEGGALSKASDAVAVKKDDVKGKEEEEKQPKSAKETHLEKIAAVSENAFKRADPKKFVTAHPVFAANVLKYKGILSNKEAKKAGFTGIIHFGTNKTREGTAGVVAKPHGLKAYGGTELTWANNQAMIKLIADNEKIKEATKKVKPGVNNANISIARLEVALHNSELIYFHLNQFNQRIITALIAEDDTYSIGAFKPVNSVTGQEFIHVYKNWARFQKSVIFLRNLAPVSKPW